MKIALFTDSFLPGMGGTEKAVLGLANEFVKQNDATFVACPNYKNSKDDFDFPVYRTKSIRLTQNDYLALPGISKSYKNHLKKFKADIVHCHSVSGMTASGIKYAKKLGVPVCVTVHTKFKMAFKRSIKSNLIVSILIKDLVKKLNKCDCVFTVSNDMVRELQSYGFKGKAIVVRNGATFKRPENIEKQAQLAIEKYGLNSVSNVFLFVGHIVKFKNLQLILDALQLVKQVNPDFKMLFVGKGFDDNYFRKQAVDMGLSDCVIFTGPVNEDVLLSCYAAADLFLFPSIFDNDPLTVVEAATYQTPSITIEGTGSSERIVDGVSGFTTKCDAKSFAEKILWCMENKEQVAAVGKNAEKLIPKLWEQTAQEYKQYYKQIISDFNNKTSK